MRSKAGRDRAGYLIEDESGNAKGTAERITFEAIALREQSGPLYFVPYGFARHVRNTSRDRVIDKFEMPLPVTAGRRIEAALNENGIEFADNTPRVTLYRGATAESQGSRSVYGGEVIVNAGGAPGRRLDLGLRPSVGCVVEMLAIPLPSGKIRKKSHRSPAKNRKYPIRQVFIP